MSEEQVEKQIVRLSAFSDGVFGEAGEIGIAEAEELLRAARIDPSRLKGNLYEKLQEKSEGYSKVGKPLPPRLRQALDDLQPKAEADTRESPLGRTAKLHVQSLLAKIRNLPHLLEVSGAPAFTAAYRNRTELTARDKQVLDIIADELRRNVHE
jgi:hypothetical protein